ncbi:MAG: hypothetical protein HOP03_12980 [Lysobacter sp.]|nr:hypothetical protein [Lysobacter sp.]
MNNQLQAPLLKRFGQFPPAMGRRYGFAAMFMSLLLLFGGTVQAQQTPAMQQLLYTKVNFDVAKVNYQIGRGYALAGKAATARTYFTSAHISAMQMYAHSLYLHQENINALVNGQYSNVYYQQLAVSYSSLLRARVNILTAHLGVLRQTPLSASARASVDADILNVYAALLYTEQAMYNAQY